MADATVPQLPRLGKNLAGRVFARLTVIDQCRDRSPTRCIVWRCLCECGQETTAVSVDLIRGHKRSCGCLNRDVLANQRTHGATNTPTYQSWTAMRHRCTNPSSKDFHNYGGRGISISQRWDDFPNFLADMGECPEGMTLERIKNDGNYEVSNCRWSTKIEQARNRRTNHLLTYNGESLCVVQWSERTGVTASTIMARLAIGWSVERTLTTRPRKYVKH